MKALACVGMGKAEQDVLEGFRRAGLVMDEVPAGELTVDRIREEEYLFVFTVDYSPDVSGICQDLLIPYFSYITEWPDRGLYDASVKNSCNFIFCFDREVYQWLHHILPERSYHLPLGTGADKISGGQAGGAGMVDVSYAGALCLDTDVYDRMDGISDFVRGYLETLLRVQTRIYGYNLLEAALNKDIVKELKRCMPYEERPGEMPGTDKNVLANCYLADKVTEMERHQLLCAVSSRFDTHIYTADTDCGIPGADIHKGKKNADIYRSSRVNLHFTHRAVTSGVPQEVYDIMAAGGFVLTNFQPEIPELFVAGEQLETYTSEEELLEKIEYYLGHEEERARIARAGQQVVRDHYSYRARAVTMFNTVFSDVK